MFKQEEKWKELINLVIEKEVENMVSDREWAPELAEKFLKEEEEKVEKHFLHKLIG